jgi:hypothetical protein
MQTVIFEGIPNNEHSLRHTNEMRNFYLPRVMDSANILTLGSVSPWLLSCLCPQMHKSSAGASILYSRAGNVFIVEDPFQRKSFASIYVYEAFSNAYQISLHIVLQSVLRSKEKVRYLLTC